MHCRYGKIKSTVPYGQVAFHNGSPRKNGRRGICKGQMRFGRKRSKPLTRTKVKRRKYDANLLVPRAHQDY